MAKDIEKFMEKSVVTESSQISTGNNEIYNEAKNIQTLCTFAAQSPETPISKERLGVDVYALQYWKDKLQSLNYDRSVLWNKEVPKYVDTIMAHYTLWMNGYHWTIEY